MKVGHWVNWLQLIILFGPKAGLLFPTYKGRILAVQNMLCFIMERVKLWGGIVFRCASISSSHFVSELHIPTFGNFWQLLIFFKKFCKFWQFLATFGNFWQLLAIKSVPLRIFKLCELVFHLSVFTFRRVRRSTLVHPFTTAKVFLENLQW